MMRWGMSVSLLEHRRNEKILEEARVEPIAMVMRVGMVRALEKKKQKTSEQLPK